MIYADYTRAMQRTADVLYQPPPEPCPPPLMFTITTFGCKEYLRRRGFITEGELVYIPVVPRLHSIADIQAEVAAYYHIPRREMTSDRRSRDVARPRQVAMYLSKQLTARSLPEIGRRFGNRDHTTVIHALRRIEKLCGTDPEMNRDVRLLTSQLEGP